MLQRARALRRASTHAETILWRLLRSRHLVGWKFRRQYPLHDYVLDFYCPAARLAVEVDGCGHLDPPQAAYDATRTERIRKDGIRILRFWNNEVLYETRAVLETILLHLEERSS